MEEGNACADKAGEEKTEKDEGAKWTCSNCGGGKLVAREVEEAFSVGSDIVLVPIRTKVCSECGERYYAPKALRKLDEIEAMVKRGAIPNLEVAGKVLRVPKELMK